MKFTHFYYSCEQCGDKEVTAIAHTETQKCIMCSGNMLFIIQHDENPDEMDFMLMLQSENDKLEGFGTIAQQEMDNIKSMENSPFQLDDDVVF